MKINKFGLALVLSMFLYSIISPINTFAATTPPLDNVETYGVLSSTYTNTTGTTINGDVGYTTPPATMPIINGTTHIADSSYNQAGISQGTILSALNSQSCDFNFSSATDLSLLPQPLAPGVYCITAATSIGTGGITLNDSGTYIFRISGALTTVDNSNVTLTGSASACNVFWTPTSATTLGADSSFIGTNIDDAGITVGSTVTWIGRALAFGGTVTTNTDTITVPSCSIPVAPTPVVTQSPTGHYTPPPTIAPTPVFTPSPILIAPTPVVTPIVTSAIVPILPKTGFAPENSTSLWNIIRDLFESLWAQKS
jgi:hypothetical protein